MFFDINSNKIIDLPELENIVSIWNTKTQDEAFPIVRPIRQRFLMTSAEWDFSEETLNEDFEKKVVFVFSDYFCFFYYRSIFWDGRCTSL